MLISLRASIIFAIDCLSWNPGYQRLSKVLRMYAFTATGRGPKFRTYDWTPGPFILGYLDRGVQPSRGSNRPPTPVMYASVQGPPRFTHRARKRARAKAIQNVASSRAFPPSERREREEKRFFYSSKGRP